MIRDGEWTTVRSRTPSDGCRGVFVFRANWCDLEYGTSLWRRNGGAIFVMEHPSWPIDGWATVTNALTFPDGTPVATPSTETINALYELKNTGYKGYVDDYSQRVALAILEDTSALQRLGRQWMLSALIGLGMRAEQVERLPPMPGVVRKLRQDAQPWSSRRW